MGNACRLDVLCADINSWQLGACCMLSAVWCWSRAERYVCQTRRSSCKMTGKNNRKISRPRILVQTVDWKWIKTLGSFLSANVSDASLYCLRELDDKKTWQKQKQWPGNVLRTSNTWSLLDGASNVRVGTLDTWWTEVRESYLQSCFRTNNSWLNILKKVLSCILEWSGKTNIEVERAGTRSRKTRKN